MSAVVSLNSSGTGADEDIVVTAIDEIATEAHGCGLAPSVEVDYVAMNVHVVCGMDLTSTSGVNAYPSFSVISPDS